MIGLVLGGPTWERREVFALGTGQRNIAAATVVASQGSAIRTWYRWWWSRRSWGC